jgi:transposase-like protein
MKPHQAYKRVKDQSDRNSTIDEATRAAIAREVIDHGKTWGELRAKYGVSSTIVRGAIAREHGPREP